MGYRSDVQLAVYAKNREDFITSFTRWRLDNGADFTEWTTWTTTETIEWTNSNGLSLYGFIFSDEQVKWYSGYYDVDEIERVMRELPDYGFSVEFLRVGEEPNDVESFERFPDGVNPFGLFWAETVISRTHILSDAAEHRLGDKSWIADYVENQSTIGDQRSDTQPA